MCPLEHDRTSGYASRISRVGDAYPYPDAVSGDVHCAPTYSVHDVAYTVILYGSECFVFFWQWVVVLRMRVARQFITIHCNPFKRLVPA